MQNNGWDQKNARKRSGLEKHPSRIAKRYFVLVKNSFVPLCLRALFRLAKVALQFGYDMETITTYPRTNGRTSFDGWTTIAKRETVAS